jgi:hypothetical protein
VSEFESLAMASENALISPFTKDPLAIDILLVSTFLMDLGMEMKFSNISNLLEFVIID